MMTAQRESTVVRAGDQRRAVVAVVSVVVALLPLVPLFVVATRVGVVAFVTEARAGPPRHGCTLAAANPSPPAAACVRRRRAPGTLDGRNRVRERAQRRALLCVALALQLLLLRLLLLKLRLLLL